MSTEQKSDRALDFAKFMVEESGDMSDQDLEAAVVERFGDLTREQVERGMSIGEEFINARIAENRAEADAVRSYLAA